jgi:hypothetical protein
LLINNGIAGSAAFLDSALAAGYEKIQFSMLHMYLCPKTKVDDQFTLANTI